MLNLTSNTRMIDTLIEVKYVLWACFRSHVLTSDFIDTFLLPFQRHSLPVSHLQFTFDLFPLTDDSYPAEPSSLSFPSSLL